MILNEPIQHKNIEIVAWKWYSGRDTVGIVLAKVPYKGYRAYIGVSQDTTEELDACYIADWGAQLEGEIMRSIFSDYLKNGQTGD